MFCILEILKIFAANETNLIPVINDKKEYLGYCDLVDILHVYNNTPFLKNEGLSYSKFIFSIPISRASGFIRA